MRYISPPFSHNSVTTQAASFDAADLSTGCGQIAKDGSASRYLIISSPEKQVC